MGSCRHRLLKEVNEIFADFILKPTEVDLLQWEATISGPPGTPYEGHFFHLTLRCPPTYPIEPPSVVFRTPIFHPNIHWRTGELCIDILKTEWSPAWSLSTVVRAVLAVLASPNGDSPLNCDAGSLVRKGHTRAFESMARYYAVEKGAEKPNTWPVLEDSVSQ
ncbi:MAG: hypothetical protein KVP17_004960 [Porospora cf. gigantea B]|uniref:uncharacterized protein n=1 Tax=Porospora cf. gigantea B TaxID=2853592 RepID=UPI003571C633|nr:MAG: hypothetical protein KVP17_004960 [Porospora cf. gigantea B]